MATKSKEEIKQNESNVGSGDLSDDLNVEEQTGFPPYWAPTEGAEFRGIVAYFDGREPDFPRHVLQATKPLVCKEGKAKEDLTVDVQPGQYFTVSDYVTLPLQEYLGHEIRVIALSKRELDGGRELWKWKLLTSKKASDAVKAAKLKALRESNQLAAQNAENAEKS